MSGIHRARTALVGLAFLLATAGTSSAQIEDPVLRFKVSNEFGSFDGAIRLQDGTWSETKRRFEWKLPKKLKLYDPANGNLVAEWSAGAMTLAVGDRIRINFDATVIAGNSLTTFEFFPALLEFRPPPDSSAEGKARFSVSLSDNNYDGAEIRAADGVDAGIFWAFYNGRVPDGAEFVRLFGNMLVGPGGVASAYQYDPAFGYRAMDGIPHDASASIRYTLTANDSAITSARYEFRFASKFDEWYFDGDADLFGDPQTLLRGNYPPTSYVRNADDCDDTNSAVNPDAEEVCNSIDDNCDGRIDENAEDSDDDGVADCIDNCPRTWNPGQEDGDDNGIGDACDDGTDGESVSLP